MAGECDSQLHAGFLVVGECDSFLRAGFHGAHGGRMRFAPTSMVGNGCRRCHRGRAMGALSMHCPRVVLRCRRGEFAYSPAPYAHRWSSMIGTDCHRVHRMHCGRIRIFARAERTSDVIADHGGRDNRAPTVDGLRWVSSDFIDDHGGRTRRFAPTCDDWRWFHRDHRGRFSVLGSRPHSRRHARHSRSSSLSDSFGPQVPTS